MSTIKVNAIKNTSTDDGGIAIDNSGHVQIDGQQLPTAGPLSNRNLVFNGACEVNQRGTVSSSASYGGPDRFIIFLNVTSYVCERSQQADAPANTGLQKCYQLKTTTARTGTTADQYVAIGQFIEFRDIYNAIWAGHSHVTMSFWVKSSITGTFAFNMNPCNTDSGLSGNRVLYHATYTISSANTWEKKTITIPLADFTDNHGVLSTAESAQIGRGLELTWVLGISSGGNRTSASTGWSTTEGRNAVSSFSSNTGFMSTVNATFKLTGVQLEVGEKATEFSHEPHAVTLAKCQRYYETTYRSGYSEGHNFNQQYPFADSRPAAINFIASDDTTSAVSFGYRVTKRADPTVRLFSANTGASNKAHTYRNGAGNNSDVTVSAVMTTPNYCTIATSLNAVNRANEAYLHIVADSEL